ncbi:MAG: glycosyltransferase [Chitinivibrionales bacterium]|nr:glycosyltransferase [Chitinivibrionales bacterium]
MSSAPALTVVVCTLNRAPLLRLCLQSLVAQTAAPESFEVLVVDNGSSDDTPLVAREFAGKIRQLRMVTEAEKGLSHARNRGFAEARGAFVGYLDDDAKVSPGWVKGVVAAFSGTDPTPSAVGGPIEPFFDGPRPKWFDDRLETRTWGDTAGFLSGDTARDGFSGSNVTFPRHYLQELGGFAAQYGMRDTTVGLGEETELCRRLYRVAPRFYYDPSLVVYHLVPREKLTLRYALRRSIADGVTSEQLRSARPNRGAAVSTLRAIAEHALLLPLKVARHGGNPRLALQVETKRLGRRLGKLKYHLRASPTGTGT